MAYVLYFLSFGSFFLIKYLRSEREIKSRKEFIFLVLFPMAGYGNWLYNKEYRVSGTTSLPRSWYIWRKMVLQNFLLILFFSFIMVFFLAYSLLNNVSDSLQFGSGSVAILKNHIDPTLSMGLFVSLIMGGVFIFTLLFFLVLIPAIIAKVIRFNYEKNT